MNKRIFSLLIKILKSDCLSTALILALVGQSNRTVRTIKRALNWFFFSLLAETNLGISCVLIAKKKSL